MSVLLTKSFARFARKAGLTGEALVEAALRGEALTQARFEAGRDSYLQRLDAQRTLYSAQQAALQARLAEQLNRVALYRALGGGWSDGAGPR